MDAPDQRRCRFRELLVVSGLILLALWIPPLQLSPEQGASLSWLHGLIKHPKPDVYFWRLGEQIIFPIVGIFILYRLFSENTAWREGIDFRRPKAMATFWWQKLWAGYMPAIRDLAAPTLLGVAILVALGWVMGSLDLGTDRFWKKLYPNTFAGQFAQQAIIQLYFNHRAMQVFGKGNKSILWVTLYFSILHLPNPALTVGVLYSMFFWARTWQRHPNLLALTFSHCLLSAFLWHTIPEAWRPSLTVGWRFIERSGWF